MRRFVLALCLTLAFHNASAEPIGPNDFAPGATVLNFDSFQSFTLLGTDFAQQGIVLGSTAPLGPQLSPDPADSLQQGEAVSPVVAVETAVPADSTSSPPNRIIGTKYGAGGEILWCERCGIVIQFPGRFPTKVGFWVSQANQGQTVQFYGPGGILWTFSVGPTAGPPQWVGYHDPAGITRVVLTSAPSVGIGLDDLTFGEFVTHYSTIPGACGLLGTEGLLLTVATRLLKRLRGSVVS